VVPTVLAAAGVELREKDNFDGVNLLPYLTGDRAGTPHDALYWRFARRRAIRHGEWKLMQENRSAPQLFNVADDAAEQRDLASQFPDRVQQLDQAWQTWSAELQELTGSR
jgi:arylsulfatase A-like enzyme